MGHLSMILNLPTSAICVFRQISASTYLINKAWTIFFRSLIVLRASTSFSSLLLGSSSSLALRRQNPAIFYLNSLEATFRRPMNDIKKIIPEEIDFENLIVLLVRTKIYFFLYSLTVSGSITETLSIYFGSLFRFLLKFSPRFNFLQSLMRIWIFTLINCAARRNPQFRRIREAPRYWIPVIRTWRCLIKNSKADALVSTKPEITDDGQRDTTKWRS